MLWAIAASPNDWLYTLRRSVAFAGLALAMLLAFTVFRPPATPGPLERDFEAYYAAGATFNAGGDPYSRAIWAAEARIPGVSSARDELLPFVGPAATLPFWSLLARIPYRAALVMWTAILMAACLIVVACALRLARSQRDPLIVAGAAATALAAAPMLSALALGQAALVSAAAIAAAIVAYRARWAPGAWLATLIAATQPNLALALAGRFRSRWDAGVAASAAAAFIVLTLAAGGGAAGFAAYIGRLRAHGDAERFITIQHTPAVVLHALGVTESAATAWGVAVAIIALIATAATIVRERLDATTATLVACAALPLALPFFHEHDFVLEVLPLLVLALRARGRPRAVAAVASILILVDWFGLAQRHFAQGQIVCLGFAVAFGFLSLAPARRRTRWDLIGFVTLAVLAAIAVPVSRAHPAPTWPDTLPAAYRAQPADDASRVWAGEQRAAGLDAGDPVWGALRALPLTGCVLLGFALAADARSRQRRGPGIRFDGQVEPAPEPITA